MRRQYAKGNYSNFKEFQRTEQTYKINEAVTCYVFPKINDLTTLEVRYSHFFGSVKWSHSRKKWKTWFFHWTTRAIVCWPLVRFWNFPILFKSNVENKCNWHECEYKVLFLRKANQRTRNCINHIITLFKIEIWKTKMFVLYQCSFLSITIIT